MAPPILVGQIIAGKYRVERVLGKGGMGVVVAARHLRLGERVAIKFPIVRDNAAGHLAERLLREGRATMRIRSEHVARIFDVGTLVTGEPYLVMQYLVGTDLGALVKQGGPLRIDVAVAYVLQAIEALTESHALGIIHRDLKPSNLFLCQRPDGSPLVKVIDFGLAKTNPTRREASGLPARQSPENSSEASLTGAAGVLGTPLYMAPEQMRGHRDVDARTDVYSLGSTLFALLTGKPPFRGTSVVEVRESMFEGIPRLRAVRPSAPAALEAILQRCMHIDPARRFQTMADLAESLAEGAPESARRSAVRARRIAESVVASRDPEAEISALGVGRERPSPDDSALGVGREMSSPDDSATGAVEPPSWHDASAGDQASVRPTSFRKPSATANGNLRFSAGTWATGVGLLGLVALAVIGFASRPHALAPAPASPTAPAEPASTTAPAKSAAPAILSAPSVTASSAGPSGPPPRAIASSGQSEAPTAAAPVPGHQKPSRDPAVRVEQQGPPSSIVASPPARPADGSGASRRMRRPDPLADPD